MSKWYKLIYKQIEPLHIGSNKHGVINETHTFVPGITMWGALTNGYFKEENRYEEILFENITCFYPMINGNVMFPRFEDGELFLGHYSEREFRRDFTTTYLSTAINPNSLHAKDESLHEIDVILPKDISWVGYLKIDNESKIPKKIVVGGDSRYGFGKMVLTSMNEENYPFDVIKGIYQSSYPKNEPLTNYLPFKHQKFEGKLELIAEFDFSSNRPKVTQGYLAITPGSRVF